MSSQNENRVIVLIAVIALAGMAAILWFNFREDAPLPETGIEEPQPAPAAAETDAPKYPLEPPRAADSEDAARQLVPLPPLDDSDAYFRLALVDLFSGRLDEILTREAVIEKFVATIDNLPRSRVAERIRPVSQPAGSFTVEAVEGEDTYRLDAANFERYEPLVSMLENADPDELVATYCRFYPLLQEAYVRLGYPEGYFNDRVVEVIDHLLAVPEVERQPKLVRPHVLYEFADPDLEALSSGHKLLLRMGPDNAARMTAVLEEIRSRLAGRDETGGG